MEQPGSLAQTKNFLLNKKKIKNKVKMIKVLYLFYFVLYLFLLLFSLNKRVYQVAPLCNTFTVLAFYMQARLSNEKKTKLKHVL